VKHPLLIHPPPFAVPDPTGWGTVSDVVPMGLLSVAEACRTAGFDPLIVQLLDAARVIASVEGNRAWDDNRWRALVHRILTEHRPRAVGVQCHWSYQWAGALAVAEWTKAFDPSIHVTMGGVHAGAMARAILETVPVVDSIVIGEGEGSYSDLLRALDAGEGSAPPEGVLWRGSDGAIEGQEIGRAVRASDVPVLTLDPALLWPENRGRYVGLPFMRGRCPKPCTFCALNSKRLYPAKQESLDHLLDTQLPVFLERSVPLYLPEHFSGHKPLEALAAALTRHGRAGQVLVDVHPGMITPRVVTALASIAARADRLRLWLGVESGSEAVRRRAGRPYGDAEVLGAFDALAAAGLAQLQSSILIGLPGETEADIGLSDRLVATLNERGILANVLPVVAFPETALYRDATSLGLTLHMKEAPSFEKLSRGWHAPIERESISFESESLDVRARIEATLKLRLRQRVRMGYRVTPELFRTMEHLPGDRAPGECEALSERYEPLLRGPRFGGPVVPTRFWAPPAGARA
jgi:radical SAM superfamily enzyme YgiQ (UPF0313 family)